MMRFFKKLWLCPCDAAQTVGYGRKNDSRCQYLSPCQLAYHLRLWCEGDSSPVIHWLVGNDRESNHIGLFIQGPLSSVCTRAGHTIWRSRPVASLRWSVLLCIRSKQSSVNINVTNDHVNQTILTCNEEYRFAKMTKRSASLLMWLSNIVVGLFYDATTVLPDVVSVASSQYGAPECPPLFTH